LLEGVLGAHPRSRPPEPAYYPDQGLRWVSRALQRTRASRFAYGQIQRHRRLAPVADLTSEV